MSLHMLIVIKDSIEPKYAVVGDAHAAVASYLKWEDEDLTYKWARQLPLD